MHIETGPYNIGPHDLPRDERGRRAWDFVCYAAADCRDKAAAIELSLHCAEQTLRDTERLDWLEKRARIGEVRAVPHSGGIALNEEDDCPISQGPTLRDAIDSAMQKEVK